MVQEKIRRALDPIGVSQIMNEGSINDFDHLHLHLVPRYDDDAFTWVSPGCRRHSVAELEAIATRIRSEQGAEPNP